MGLQYGALTRLSIRLNTSLWTFTVSLYQQPGVEEECLLLQDRFGVNANLLFLSLYTGSEFGVILTGSDIDAAECAIADWNSQVVKVLRGLRQLLKRSKGLHAQEIESLRTQIKEAELASERIESVMLQEWCGAWLTRLSRAAREAAVDTNFCSVLAHYGAEREPESSRLVSLVLSSKSPP